MTVHCFVSRNEELMIEPQELHLNCLWHSAIRNYEVFIICSSMCFIIVRRKLSMSQDRWAFSLSKEACQDLVNEKQNEFLISPGLMGQNIVLRIIRCRQLSPFLSCQTQAYHNMPVAPPDERTMPGVAMLLGAVGIGMCGYGSRQLALHHRPSTRVLHWVGTHTDASSVGTGAHAQRGPFLDATRRAAACQEIPPPSFVGQKFPWISVTVYSVEFGQLYGLSSGKCAFTRLRLKLCRPVATMRPMCSLKVRKCRCLT